MDRPRPSRRPVPPPGAVRALTGVLAVLVLSLIGAGPDDALAQNNRYKYETDPVRLGFKAINDGRLDEARAHFDEAIENEYRVNDAHHGIGEIHLLHGLYDEAEAEFDIAAKAEKPVPEAWAGLGLVNLRQGENAEALAAFQRALELDKNLWRAQYGLALFAINDGDLTRAEELIEKGKKKGGVEDGEHFYHHGAARLLIARAEQETDPEVKKKILDEAEKHAIKAFELAPGNPDVVLVYATVYEKKNVRPLAIQKLEEVRDDESVIANKANIHYRLGILYERERRFEDAVASYQRAVQADPSLADAYLHVGAIFATAQQYLQAIQAYGQYTKLKPGDVEGHRRLAETCFDSRDPQFRLVGFEAAKKAVEIDDDDEGNLFVLARTASLVSEQHDTALDTYLMLDELDYEGRDYYNLGNLYYFQQVDERPALRDFDEARLAYETAIELDSTLTDVYFRLGIIDLVDGDWASAEEYLERANRATPDNDQVLTNLGQAKLQQKKFGEAASIFKRAHELAPGNPQPVVLLAQCLVFQQDYAGAIATYTRALEIDPANASACGGRGQLLLLQEEFADAETDLRCATQGMESNDRYWAWLGQALHFQGKLMEARSAYQRALTLNSSNTDAQEGMQSLQQASGR